MAAIEEKIAYVQALWDLIVSRPDDLPVPEWHRAVFAERLAEARSESGRPSNKSLQLTAHASYARAGRS